MATRVHINNFQTTLNGGINNSTTTVVITSATGLPVLSGGDYYYLTLVSGSTIEIIKVTARTGTTLTVVRAQESTSAVSWSDSSLVSLRATANSIDSKQDIASNTVTVATGDLVVVQDISDSNNIARVTAQSIANLAPATTPGGATTNVQYNNSSAFAGDANFTYDGAGTATLKTGLIVGGNATAAGFITLLEDTDNGSNKLDIKPPQSIATDKVVTFQDVTGTVYVSTGTDVALADGGTNASLTADNGAIPYSTSSAIALLASTATASKMLLSGSSAAPTWSTSTIPTSAGTAGKILRSDGTNYASTTSTFADTYAVSTILYASSANTIAGLATANDGFLNTSPTGVPSIVTPASVTVASNDRVLIQDASNSLAFAYVTASSLAGIGAPNLDAPAGTENVIGGTGAGAALATNGNFNTFLGYNAGVGLTVGDNCTAIGNRSLAAATTTNALNATAIGSGALGAVTSGLDNTAVGYLAGASVASGSDGTYVGKGAGGATTGSSNTAIGPRTMANGTAGRSLNVMIGPDAGSFGTGNNNVAIGSNNGAGAAGRQHGASNTYIGASSGANSTSDSNVGIGYNAMGDSTGGASTKNTAIGALTMNSGATGAVVLTSASGNTIVGYRAGVSAADCADAIAIGQDAVATKATGSTSGTFGPGISMGSAAKPVGWRGDGSIIPSTTGGAGFWKAKINGTQYYIPLFADASTTMTGSGTGGIAGTTSPTFVTPVLGAASATSVALSNTGILDSNSFSMIAFSAAASATNYFTMTNAASGNPLVIAASGSDTNVDIRVLPKAGGVLNLLTTANNPIVLQTGTGYQHTASFNFANAATSRTYTFPEASGTVALTEALGAASATSLSFSSTSGIIGTTTNDSAAAGSVGELVISTKTFVVPVSLTSDTATDITSISLTAGDWDLYGRVGFTGGAATLVQYAQGWISATSATQPSLDGMCAISYAASGVAAFSNASPLFEIGPYNLQLATTTTVYLSTQVGFSVSTCNGFGQIVARRRR